MSFEKKITYRSLVLRESLVTGEPLHEMLRFIETEYNYLLDGKRPVRVIRLQIPQTDLIHVAWEVALNLLPTHYFANFTGISDMLVVFPNTLVRVLRHNPTTAELARSLGRQFRIPDHQMRFGAMFEEDHPHVG